MDESRVIEVKRSILDTNDRTADRFRLERKNEGTFLTDIMGSPGAGKTTFLLALIEQLKAIEDARMAVIEADLESDVDALKIKAAASLCKYKVAVKDGRVTAVDADVRFNAGGYSTLSAVVLQRGIIAAPGVYEIPNVHPQGGAPCQPRADRPEGGDCRHIRPRRDSRGNAGAALTDVSAVRIFSDSCAHGGKFCRGSNMKQCAS